MYCFKIYRQTNNFNVLALPNFSATSWADMPNWPQMTSPSGSQPGTKFIKLIVPKT